MAWIKWEVGLENKPEVVRMAAALAMSREVVACRLMNFWKWCDENIPDSDIRDNGSAYAALSPNNGDNMAFVDDIVRTPKFAEALAAVDWIRFRDGRIELPNFGRHNGETAKTRARNSKAQKKKRDKDAEPDTPDSDSSVRDLSSHDDDISMTRGEERRGEYPAKKSPKNNITPCKSPKGDVHFLPWWEKYPKKVGKDKARAAWIKAGKRIRLERQCSGIEAIAHMQEAVEAFAVTPKALGPYCPNPATWLNGGNYDDDRAMWNTPQETTANERHSIDLAALDLELP